MVWNVEIRVGAKRTLDKLDSQQSKRILKFLFDRLVHLDNPRSIGEALRGSRFKSLWKYRVGDYRLICSIEDHVFTILVVSVGHRKEIYEN